MKFYESEDNDSNRVRQRQLVLSGGTLASPPPRVIEAFRLLVRGQDRNMFPRLTSPWEEVAQKVEAAWAAGRNDLNNVLCEALCSSGLDADAVVNSILAGPGPAESPASWANLVPIIGGIKFAWDKWLAEAMVTLLASHPGVGKSFLALIIARTIICGTPWPDGTPYNGPLGAVLWLETEAAQPINFERATKWGLPLEKIFTPFADPMVDILLDNPKHREAITEKASLEEVRLVVLDSLSGASERDENKGEAAGTVRWLARLARDTGKPCLVLHHLRKRGLRDGNKITLDMLRGHSGIAQTARVVWALDVPDPAVPGHKVLSVLKSNLSAPPAPLEIRSISDTGIEFATRQEAPLLPRPKSQLERAQEWLVETLAEGPVRAKEVHARAKAAGISESTLNRAKTAQGIDPRKMGGRAGDPWWWSLSTGEGV